jgi:hypothetical protein
MPVVITGGLFVSLHSPCTSLGIPCASLSIACSNAMEFTWISSAASFIEDNDENYVGLNIVPEPVNWKLMAASNVQRVLDGSDEIFVNCSGIGMSCHKYINMKVFTQGGVKYHCWSHCAGQWRMVVARFLPVEALNVTLQTSYEGESLYVKAISAGSAVIHEEAFDSAKVLTYGWIGFKLLEHLMVETGASRFTDLKISKNGVVMSSKVRLWSPTWATKSSSRPVRRVVGKQRPTMQRTLAMYFSSRVTKQMQTGLSKTG